MIRALALLTILVPALTESADGDFDDGVAQYGQPCNDSKCGSFYCNPSSMKCTDFPGDGEACAAHKDTGDSGEVCSRFSADGVLYCKSGTCALERKAGDSCEVGLDKCASPRMCAALEDGSGGRCHEVVGLEMLAETQRVRSAGAKGTCAVAPR